MTRPNWLHLNRALSRTRLTDMPSGNSTAKLGWVRFLNYGGANGHLIILSSWYLRPLVNIGGSVAFGLMAKFKGAFPLVNIMGSHWDVIVTNHTHNYVQDLLLLMRKLICPGKIFKNTWSNYKRPELINTEKEPKFWGDFQIGWYWLIIMSSQMMLYKNEK